MGRNIVEETVLLVKTQTAQGTPAVPGPTTDAMLAFEDGNIIQANTVFIPKRPLKSDHEPGKQGVGRRLQNYRIQTVLMNRSNNGGVPWIDPLLKMSGLEMVFTAATGGITYDAWKYKPRSNGFQYSTIYSYQDGIFHQAPDSIGTYEVSGNAGEMLDAIFSGSGLYVAPTSVANPVPTLPTNTMAMIESWGLTIGAYVPEVLSFRLTHANRIPELRDANKPKGFGGLAITGREPIIDLRIRCEDTLANKDFFAYIDEQAALDDASMDPVSFTHPGADPAQSSIYFEAPSPQLIQDPTYENVEGFRVYQLRYLCRSDTPNGGYFWEWREEAP